MTKSTGFVLVTALLELFRRFIWNFIRIENEYVNDCLQFHSLLAGEGMVSEPTEAAPELNDETYAATRARHTGHPSVP